jgi:hypothetical protein
MGVVVLSSGFVGFRDAKAEVAQREAAVRQVNDWVVPPASESKQPAWMVEMNANPKNVNAKGLEPSFVLCSQEMEHPNRATKQLEQDCVDYYGAAAFLQSQKNGD